MTQRFLDRDRTMPTIIDRAETLLFVPSDRPDRFAKAFASRADAVILDLEDALPNNQKDAGRQAAQNATADIAAAPCTVLVRINGVASPHHEADLEAITRWPVAGVVLPKAESADVVVAVARLTGRPVIALVESALGLVAARSIASTGARLAFGSIDFAVDLGCAHNRDALLAARSELVLASRLAGIPGPIDGVTTATKDVDAVRDDMAYAAALGFTGKLLIHPAQIEPAKQGLTPTAEETRWAERVLAAGSDRGATALDGTMVDAPVRLRAEQIRRRSSGLLQKGV